MSWIDTIDYQESSGHLKTIFDSVRGKDNYLDNVIKVHGLRPHTLEGHLTLYKNVLHHRGNKLPRWVRELIGVYVSYLNGCDYCYKHHSANLTQILDQKRSRELTEAIETETVEQAIDESLYVLLCYCRKLTEHPASMSKSDIKRLRKAGYEDGEILEANQVTSYFCYVNRTANGLGVKTKGDRLDVMPD